MQAKVGDLLRMCGGIADSADAELLRQCYDDPLLTLEANDPIKHAVSKAHEFEPLNQKAKYTNVNYNILKNRPLCLRQRPQRANHRRHLQAAGREGLALSNHQRDAWRTMRLRFGCPWVTSYAIGDWKGKKCGMGLPFSRGANSDGRAKKH
jgi:hypothetical protein